MMSFSNLLHYMAGISIWLSTICKMANGFLHHGDCSTHGYFSSNIIMFIIITPHHGCITNPRHSRATLSTLILVVVPTVGFIFVPLPTKSTDHSVSQKITQKSLYLNSMQLRVARAFRSILEDLEDKRSTHSINCIKSSRSHPVMSASVNRQSSEAVYIDEDKPNVHPNSGHNNMMMLVWDTLT